MISLFASWLVDTSLRASAAIVFLLCLRPTLRRWIGSRALAWVWLAVVARLLFPLPVSVPWLILPWLPAPAATASSYHFRVSVAPTDTATDSGVATPMRRTMPLQARSWPDVLSCLWLLGASLAVIRLAHGWWITRRWSARTFPASPGLQSTYLDLPAGLRRGVALRLTDALDVPTLVGVLRPQIWLPRTLPDALSSAEIRHILLHELGHARRCDLLAQWLCALACCLHWFNPLVWLLARAARTDRELACDAWVLSCDAMQAESAGSYGHTLLKVVEGMRQQTPCALPTVSMAAGKRHLGLRVREIRAFRPVAPWRGVVALAMVTALVAAFTLKGAMTASATDAASPPPRSAPPPSPPSSTNVSPAPATSTPSVPGPSARPIQVEIESKFIEVAKSSASELEKSLPASSPIAHVFHQIFAQFTAQASPSSPTIFRSAPVLPANFDLLLRQMNQAKGIDLLSAPRVTTKSEQKATIEIIREFIYPTAFQRDKGPFDKPVTTPTNFDKKNTGVTLEVAPTIEPDGELIDLALTWTITNFDGFVDADGKPVPRNEKEMPEKMPGATFPVFDTRTVSTVATLPSGATVVFIRDEEDFFARRSLRFAMGEAKRKVSSTKAGKRLLLVCITAKLVPPAGGSGTGDHPSTTDSVRTTGATPSPSQPTGSPASLPYGNFAPGKPGFAISPYAPEAGYVDLHGFTRGQEVRDPYTGKMFLVP